MKCECTKIPKISYYERLSNEFFKFLKKVEVSGWYELYQCSICGQYWRIDLYDKYQQRFVVKFSNIGNWKNFDATDLIKELIITEHGGLQDKDCIMKDCKNKRVVKSVYCIDHLFEGGIRK